MKKSPFKITMLWKFFYWVVVWALIFAPMLARPATLKGMWMVVARVAGLVLVVYATFLAATGGRTLSRFAHQEAHETFWPDRFTTSGIFGCMRHPMHQGLAIFPVALALLSGRILIIAASGWGVAAALGFVLLVEEKETLEKYGQAYSEYMMQVPPFSLKWRCIKAGLEVWRQKG